MKALRTAAHVLILECLALGAASRPSEEQSLGVTLHAGGHWTTVDMGLAILLRSSSILSLNRSIQCWYLSERMHVPVADNSRANDISEQKFRKEWQAGAIPSGRASFAKLMAMCALSAHRIRNGASLTPRQVSDDLNSRLYLDEALTAIPGNIGDVQEFECLQAIELLCLTALQNNDVPLLHKLQGMYHAALAEQGFCDEKRWPRDLSIIEREERRRLFWHMYRLEVHTSLVIGHVVRCPELQSSVAYPTLPDDDFTESSGDYEWLRGWNFITDLYRGLEHVIALFKSRRASANVENRSLSTSFALDYDPQEKILGPLAIARRNLPSRFQKAMKISSDVRRNRCGFQAANIACTYQVSFFERGTLWLFLIL
jgi:hypothetical protein